MNSRLDWLVLSGYIIRFTLLTFRREREMRTPFFNGVRIFYTMFKSPSKCYPYDLSAIWFKVAVYG